MKQGGSQLVSIAAGTGMFSTAFNNQLRSAGQGGLFFAQIEGGGSTFSLDGRTQQ
jgi:hypothetical protein